MSGLRQILLTSWRSIKTRMALGAVAALTLGIALTTLLLVRQAERDTLASQRQRELHEASRTAGVLSRRVVELQRALAATAAIVDEPLLSDGARMAAFLVSQPVLRGLFSNVFVADATGRVTAMADRDGQQKAVLNIADRAYFKQTLAEQRPVVSEPVSSRVSSQPIVIFTYPIKTPAGKVGVLGGTLKLTSRDLMVDLVDKDEDATQTLVLVTDAAGRIIAHPDRDRIMQSISTEPRMAEGFAHWLVAGAALEPSGLLVDQPGQVLALAGAAGPDWVVWRALPESELLEPLHAARRKALAWAVAVVAAASLAAFALIAWLLRPLTLLKQRAAHLFDADNDTDAGWPEAQGELGELSRVLRRVTGERAELERINSQVLRKLGSVMAAAPLGIMFTRAQKFELVSAQFCRMFGRPESEYLGQHASGIFASKDDYARLGPLVGAAFADNAPYVGEWKLLRPNGSTFWARLRSQAVEHGNPDAGTIWTLDDVSEEVATRAELEWSAGHDALTGLANRKLFEQRAARTFDALPRSLPSAVVMIDLDRFKPINDTAGHAAGDAMLKAVATTVSAHVRASDLAARLGGDEFALLLERCPASVAERIANTVRQAIAETVVHWQGHRLTVGASLGVAILTAETADLAGWLQEADRACYEAKAAGRNLVCVSQRPLPGLRAVG